MFYYCIALSVHDVFILYMMFIRMFEAIMMTSIGLCEVTALFMTHVLCCISQGIIKYHSREIDDFDVILFQIYQSLMC